MARNVEIKARVSSIEALLPKVRALAGHGPELIAQDDTFFACAVGRLKLRVFAEGHGELIAYERPDAVGPKTSNYRVAPVADPQALRATLIRTLLRRLRRPFARAGNAHLSQAQPSCRLALRRCSNRCSAQAVVPVSTRYTKATAR